MTAPVWKYRITTVESEAGWGQRHEYEYFDSAAEAKARIDYINSFNISPTAPRWYFQADSEIKAVQVDEAGKEV